MSETVAVAVRNMATVSQKAQPASTFEHLVLPQAFSPKLDFGVTEKGDQEIGSCL